MSENSSPADLAAYQALVQRYEALDQQIRVLLSDGDEARSQHLPQYRALARERDEVFSELRAMEQALRLDE